jgi:hypothetical protein
MASDFTVAWLYSQITFFFSNQTPRQANSALKGDLRTKNLRGQNVHLLPSRMTSSDEICLMGGECSGQCFENYINSPHCWVTFPPVKDFD